MCVCVRVGGETYRPLIFLAVLGMPMRLRAGHIMHEFVCDVSKGGHVDLMACNGSLSDVSHRCVAVTPGGFRSNV